MPVAWKDMPPLHDHEWCELCLLQYEEDFGYLTK